MKPARITLDQMNGTTNPSSPTAEGRLAAQQVEKAREQVADLIGARAQEIVFTSSGTEANTWALIGLTQANPHPSPRPSSSRGEGKGEGKHLVVSAVEQPTRGGFQEDRSDSFQERLRLESDRGEDEEEVGGRLYHRLSGP